MSQFLPLMRLLMVRSRQVIVGLALGAFAIGIAVWGIPLAALTEAFRGADLVWLVPPAAIFLVQQVLRAWRQALILRSTHPEHTYRTSLSVLCVGFLFINTLPARLGEVVRPLLLLEREDIPLGTGVAAVFLERAIDLCAMLVMIGIVAWLVPVPSQVLVVGGTSIDWVALGKVAAGTAVPAVLIGLAVTVWGGQPMLRRARSLEGRLPLSAGRLVRIVVTFGESFVEGLSAVRQPKRAAGIVGLTILTWSATVLMYPALARAFGIESLIGIGEGLGVLAITMLGMAVPAAPGFAGTYEAFVRGGLALFGVQGESAGMNLDATALAYALTMHWWIYAVQAVTAMYFLAVDRISPVATVKALYATFQTPSDGVEGPR